MSDWTSAYEALPPAKPDDHEHSKDVLAYVVGLGGYFRMLTVFYSHAEEEWYLDDGESMQAGETVKHWMPLPNLP
ncbi:hypothetical protein N5D61_24520 [Pseudomonas sp. GD03842]|uniref:hypothetical protein n=1 Tax=Pseudomonas sp. GD03842 TaxID=2975385 RepID=UPI00244AB1B9|nr:hypothetical protein [Pseudomonas sp. GD03842]MDH0749493.1 hypothetical protein [Pseudomonas sp. GD03842]